MNPRTALRRSAVFKTAPFDRSGTPPWEVQGSRALEGGPQEPARSSDILSDPGEVAEWLKAAPC